MVARAPSRSAPPSFATAFATLLLLASAPLAAQRGPDADTVAVAMTFTLSGYGSDAVFVALGAPTAVPR